MAPSTSSSYTKPHTTHHRDSCAHFLCKSLFFFIFLLLLPLFPSKAPDFVNHTLLTNFWELLHLLFVGIAVSYGLFSRRSIQVSVDEARFSNFENPHSYLSKIFHAASIFEDVQLLTASDENKVDDVWYIQPHRELATDFGDLNADSCERRYENSYEFLDSDNVGHACKSRYSWGGSVVVVTESEKNRSSTSGEWVEPGAIVHYKPLGLPVRSLRSNLIEESETDDVEFGEESGLSSRSSSKSSETCERRSEFGENCCTNLEEKFDEAGIALLSPFQWREKSGKKMMRERGMRNSIVRPSHCRPPSIDETQFESLKESRSLHSTLSQSSQTSSFSSSSSKMTRKHRKMLSLSHISSTSLHSRQYSMDSLSENSRGSSKDHLIETENLSECNESQISFLHLDRNFGSLPKDVSRGKSVRTIRANAVAAEEMKAQEMYRNQVEYDITIGKKFEEGGGALSYMREDGIEYGWPSVANPNANRFPKTTSPEIEKQIKKEDSESLLRDDATDHSEREDESIFASSDEEVEAASTVAGESESRAHEVDKKAGEFIAKFREQIQLQRMASVERLRGGWGSFSSTSSGHFS